MLQTGNYKTDLQNKLFFSSMWVNLTSHEEESSIVLFLYEENVMRINKIKTACFNGFLKYQKLCCVFAAIKKRTDNHNAKVYDQEKDLET